MPTPPESFSTPVPSAHGGSGAEPPSFVRFRATIAYDGAPFFGWQRQPSRPTVQGTLETALASLLGFAPPGGGSGAEPPSVCIPIHSCGRTDTGVHARAQVAHFDLPGGSGAPPPSLALRPPEGRPSAGPWNAPALQKGLNPLLPPSIRILSLRPVPPSFHARYSARAKRYLYRIDNAPVPDPLLRHLALHVRAPLDLSAMRDAASALVGTHDFAAFSANPHRETAGTVRTIFSISVTRRASLVTIAVTGNGFLYKMVRSIAGFLIRVGRHAIPPSEAPLILDSRLRTARVETAPPHGLLLDHIYYSPLSRFPPPAHPCPPSEP